MSLLICSFCFQCRPLSLSVVLFCFFGELWFSCSVELESLGSLGLFCCFWFGVLPVTDAFVFLPLPVFARLHVSCTACSLVVLSVLFFLTLFCSVSSSAVRSDVFSLFHLH